MVKQVLGGAAVGLAAVGISALGRVALLAGMGVAGLVGGGEMIREARARGVRPAPAVGLAGILALLVVGYARGERAVDAFPLVLAAVIGLAFAVMLARADRTDVARGMAATLLPVALVGLLGAYVTALRASSGGFRATVALLLFALASETGLRLASLPSAGPRGIAGGMPGGPTWEGAIAGALAAAVTALAAGPLIDLPMSGGSALVLSLLVSASVPLGALATRMLGAHPGQDPVPRARVLDRLEGLLVSAPVFYYAWRALER